MTVGKFYATFLIQDYFRRFKKKKESRTTADNVDSQAQESQAVTLQVRQAIKYMGGQIIGKKH